jgi:hypothetical protein
MRRHVKNLVLLPNNSTIGYDTTGLCLHSKHSLYLKNNFAIICGCIPGKQTAAPQAGSKQLTHWTSETVYSIRVKLQVFHKHPPLPRNLTRGFNRSLFCEEEDDLQGTEWNQGKHD